MHDGQTPPTNSSDIVFTLHGGTTRILTDRELTIAYAKHAKVNTRKTGVTLAGTRRFLENIAAAGLDGVGHWPAVEGVTHNVNYIGIWADAARTVLHQMNPKLDVLSCNNTMFMLDHGMLQKTALTVDGKTYAVPMPEKMNGRLGIRIVSLSRLAAAPQHKLSGKETFEIGARHDWQKSSSHSRYENQAGQLTSYLQEQGVPLAVKYSPRSTEVRVVPQALRPVLNIPASRMAAISAVKKRP